MTPEIMHRFTLHLKEQMELYLVRSAQRQQLRDAPDYELDDEDALQDEEFNDDTFLGDASSVMSSLFRTYGVAYYPYFDELLPKFNEFAVSFVLVLTT